MTRAAPAAETATMAPAAGRRFLTAVASGHRRLRPRAALTYIASSGSDNPLTAIAFRAVSRGPARRPGGQRAPRLVRACAAAMPASLKLARAVSARAYDLGHEVHGSRRRWETCGHGLPCLGCHVGAMDPRRPPMHIDDDGHGPVTAVSDDSLIEAAGRGDHEAYG